MADTTKIIDKFSYDGVTYVLQDNNSGYTSNVGTVTGVKVNGTTINPQSGVVDLGNIATSSSIPGPATATPLMDGTAAVGTATKYAKEDHVHPSDTNKVDIRSDTEWGSFGEIFNDPNDGTIYMHYSSEDESLSSFMTLFDGEFQLGSYENSLGSTFIHGVTVTQSPNPEDDGALIQLQAIKYGTPNISNKLAMTPTTTEIHNVVTPTVDGDAANKKYVDDSIPTNVSAFTNDAGYITSDTQVTSTAVTAATTNYIVGSTSSSTATGTLSKHASAVLYTTANSGTSGYTQLRLGNTTATSSAGGKEGQIRLYGTNATYYLDLKPGAIASSNKTITFPNATGTVALTSDIPTVPSAGTSAQSVGTTNSGGSATTWSKSDHVHAISSSTITSALGFTPSSTDNKVLQTGGTGNSQYRVLFSNAANDNDDTASTQKSVYLRFNPSIPVLYTGSHVEQGAITYYSQMGIENSGNGFSLDSHSATSYSSAWTPGAFRLQHWASSKGTGGSIDPANYVDSMLNMSTSSLYIREYDNLDSIVNFNSIAADGILMMQNNNSWDSATNGVSINNNGSISLKNGSATASSITPTKISNWDAHITNNSSVTAQTTQAVYPIKIDSKGHISAYGSAVSNIVQTTATQTLTNKTLTSPKINTPTVGSITQVVTSTSNISNWAEANTYSTSNTTGGVGTIADIWVNRWGPVVQGYIRFTSSSAAAVGTTRTFFTPTDLFKSKGLFYLQVNATASPYAQVTNASFWFTSGGIMQGRCAASTEYRVSFMYLATGG